MIASPAFFPSSAQEVVGYHGTTMRSAESIVNKRVSPDYFKMSNNDHDWLGPGAYFFQDAPMRALLFAEKRSNQLTADGTPDEPAVIRAKFRLLNCLDLLDVSAGVYVRFVHELMTKEYPKVGRTLPTQIGMTLNTGPRAHIKIPRGRFRAIDQRALHYLDRETLERTILFLMKQEDIIVDSVRCAFVDGYPLYSTSWIFDVSHVQVCIRNILKCMVEEPKIVTIDEIVTYRNAVNDQLEAMNRKTGNKINL